MVSQKKEQPFYTLTAPIMKGFAWACGAVVIFNMVAVICDVTGRYLFNSPIKGVTEVCTMMMAWIAYLGLAYVLLSGKHMQLGLVYDKLRGRQAHIASFLIYLLGLALYIIFIRASYDVFMASYSINERAVASVVVYVWIGKLGPVVGWILISIQSAFMIAYSFAGIINPGKYVPLSAKSEIPTEEELEQYSLSKRIKIISDKGDEK